MCYNTRPSSRNDAAGHWPPPGHDPRAAEAGVGNSCVAKMKLTIERAAFLKALGHVQSVVERRTTIPILSNVLLRA